MKTAERGWRTSAPNIVQALLAPGFFGLGESRSKNGWCTMGASSFHSVRATMSTCMLPGCALIPMPVLAWSAGCSALGHMGGTLAGHHCRAEQLWRRLEELSACAAGYLIESLQSWPGQPDLRPKDVIVAAGEAS